MSVKERIATLTMEKALESLSDYKQGLIYKISSVDIVDASDIKSFDTSDLQEAYFFDEGKQIHIYQSEEGFMASMIQDNEETEEHTVLKTYPIAGKHKEKAKQVTVKEYLDFDDDGQVYVAYTRLVRLV